MKPERKAQSKTSGVRLRKTPDTTNSANIIKELAQGEEVVICDGPWLRVKVANQEGWVHGDYISEMTSAAISAFKIGIPNLFQDALAQEVRREIGDEYGGGKNKWELQCTEYVTYRVKTKLGIVIKWPITSGRNGGKWGAIFQKYKTYPVSSDPKINSAMSFTTGISSSAETNEIGHVAFVEEVYPDGSIKISEANWPRNGIYNERVLKKSEWKDKYKALFTAFG